MSMGTSSTRRVETDALVDGCELSEEAPTVETTEKREMRPRTIEHVGLRAAGNFDLVSS